MKLLLAISLPLIFLVFSLLIFIRSNEFYPPSKLVHECYDNSIPFLYGPAYSDFNTSIKLNWVLTHHPYIIALGTSRVMQFRSYFFKNHVEFYNAGGCINWIKDYRYFIDSIPKNDNPRVIIVGLDQYFFNSNFEHFLDSFNQKSVSNNPLLAAKIFKNNYFKPIIDLSKKKFSLMNLFNHQNDTLLIGLNAITNKCGFRNDGSYSYGAINYTNQKSDDYLFTDTLKRIKNGNRRFQYGTEVSSKSISEIEYFLSECRDRNIHVIGFLPPFSGFIYHKLLSMHQKYAYIFNIYPSLKKIFDKYNYHIFDYTDIVTINSTDEEAIDGFHMSEKAYLKLFIEMAKTDTSLKRLAQDERYLNNIYLNKVN